MRLSLLDWILVILFPLLSLLIGAGTGLLFLLRWFWWRVNACSEFAAMAISVAVLATVFIWRSWDALFERGAEGRFQHAMEPSL